jgi:hypothetical protein
MNKKEIKALDNNKLLIEFYWIAVKTTNEVNSRRGLTKKTALKEERLLEELAERFGLDIAQLKKETE